MCFPCARLISYILVPGVSEAFVVCFLPRLCFDVIHSSIWDTKQPVGYCHRPACLCVCLWARHLSFLSDKLDLSRWWQTSLSFLLVSWNWWGNQPRMCVWFLCVFCATVPEYSMFLGTQTQHVCIVEKPQSTWSCAIMIFRLMFHTWNYIHQFHAMTDKSVLLLFYSKMIDYRFNAGTQRYVQTKISWMSQPSYEGEGRARDKGLS